VTGLNCQELAAELSTFVPARRLDDHVQIMLRFAEGARGLLWASQVATGNQNNLRLRVFGEKGGMEWRQEDPNCLWFAPLGKTPTLIYRAGPGATAVSAHASRVPSGHPEGYLEAFAQLYTDIAEQISARLEKRSPSLSSMLVPTVEDGVAGMQFISAVLASSSRNSAWTVVAGRD
jgi:predicted dehydrogenase